MSVDVTYGRVDENLRGTKRNVWYGSSIVRAVSALVAFHLTLHSVGTRRRCEDQQRAGRVVDTDHSHVSALHSRLDHAN
jgi:hypothetical protein